MAYQFDIQLTSLFDKVAELQEEFQAECENFIKWKKQTKAEHKALVEESKGNNITKKNTKKVLAENNRSSPIIKSTPPLPQEQTTKEPLTSKRDSSKENVVVKIEKLDENTSSRPRRNAAKEASGALKDQVNQKLNSKLRQQLVNNIPVQVKQEKLDNERSEETTSSPTEKQLMPPPLGRPKRNARKKGTETDEEKVQKEDETISKEIKKEKISLVTTEDKPKRSTRTKTRAALAADSQKSHQELIIRKDSDVIFNNVPPVVLEISDSDIDTSLEQKSTLSDERSSSQETKNKKTTRAKTANKKVAPKESEDDGEASGPCTEAVPAKKARTKKNAAATKQKSKDMEDESETASDSSQKNTKSTATAGLRKRIISTSEEENTDAETKTSRTTRTKQKTKKTKNMVMEEKAKEKTAAMEPSSPKEDAFKSSEMERTYVKSPQLALPITEATMLVTTPKSNIEQLISLDNAKKAPNINKTITMSKNMDITTVVTSPNKQFEQVCITNSILTDDDDPNPSDMEAAVVKTKPSKLKSPSKPVKKPVFNPYTSSPVKQRVEAFEKMAIAASSEEDPPARRTRTKKRNEEKQAEAATNNLSAPKPMQPKFFTPTYNNRVLPSFATSGGSVIMAKAHTTEQNSRIIKRQDLDDAQKKKEEMMKQRAELQKKKREEKQQRAQQIREAQEKEKRIMMEKEQQEKEAKLEKMMAEKEEKKLRLREENQRKKMMAIKAMEEKRAAEEKEKMDLEKKIAVEKGKQNGGETAQPSTPELISKNTRRPDWASTINLEATSYMQGFIPRTIINTYFSCRPLTIDLREIFPNISQRHLERKSSACWQTPPRYTKFHIE